MKTIITKSQGSFYFFICFFFCQSLFADTYPTPTGLKIGQAAIGPEATLQPGHSADVNITFTGNATGCAVVVFDISTMGHPSPNPSPYPETDWIMHERGISPENKTIHLSNNGSAAKTYSVTAWTFVGGPPWASSVYNHKTNTPYHPGWWGASRKQNGDFIAYGSANGPTSIHIVIDSH